MFINDFTYIGIDSKEEYHPRLSDLSAVLRPSADGNSKPGHFLNTATPPQLRRGKCTSIAPMFPNRKPGLHLR